MASRKELDILFKATNISKSFGEFKANIDINISIQINRQEHSGYPGVD